MIRLAFGIFLVCVAIVAGIAIWGEPGAASLTWLGWRVDTTAAAGVLLIGLLALMAMIFWRVLVWLIQSPVRSARAKAEARRRAGAEALTRGFLAAAAGDGAEARRLAGRAASLADETPQLVRILAAQAAEASGDEADAKAAYGAMLGFPEMRLAAHRGLMQAAVAAGDKVQALAEAKAAYDLAHTAPWAWRALLDDRLEGGDWSGALALVAGALERKIVSPLTAERARAALRTAGAVSPRATADGHAPDDGRRRDQTLESAQAAAKARPDFTPAAVIAATLLAAEGRAARAGPVLETAWKARPHPALWRAFRDLETAETPPERAARLTAFADLAPQAREARILKVEAALIAGDGVGARAAAAALGAETPTQRLAGLFARVATAMGERDEAGAWIARGAGAPGEADWSDIEPGGAAFAYSLADWARLIGAYIESGEIIHPRFERGEAEISDLPEIPRAYADSTPFVSAAQAGEPFPPIVEDSDFGEALQPAGAASTPARSGVFRGLGGRGKGR
ncbi:MAG TPA: heme biosynthesis HemY N-terminal domain-containing protein [Caulobacteraceae bacterium]